MHKKISGTWNSSNVQGRPTNKIHYLFKKYTQRTKFVRSLPKPELITDSPILRLNFRSSAMTFYFDLPPAPPPLPLLPVPTVELVIKKVIKSYFFITNSQATS